MLHVFHDGIDFLSSVVVVDGGDRAGGIQNGLLQALYSPHTYGVCILSTCNFIQQVVKVGSIWLEN